MGKRRSRRHVPDDSSLVPPTPDGSSCNESLVDLSHVKHEIVEQSDVEMEIPSVCETPIQSQARRARSKSRGRGNRNMNRSMSEGPRTRSRSRVMLRQKAEQEQEELDALANNSTSNLKSEEKPAPKRRGRKPKGFSAPFLQEDSAKIKPAPAAAENTGRQSPIISPSRNEVTSSTANEDQGNMAPNTEVSSSFPTGDDQPLQTSTPIKRPNFPTYTFFSLVTGDENQDKDGSPKNLVTTDPILNTPVQNNAHQLQLVEGVDFITPRPENIFLDGEDQDRGVQGQKLLRGSGGGRGGRRQASSTTPRCRPRTTGNYLNSPLYVGVDLDSIASSDEEENANNAGYRLRPRNLFNSGVSIKQYNMFGDHDSDSEEDKEKDNDDEDVYFFLQSEEEEDDLEMDERVDYHEKKRSSYSGIRGPKADQKALSLVTNCPVSVKWLVDNFEYCPGRSLPRGFVYDQYVLLCTENGLEPVNAASFGKLIRSVFPGLKTRRLGTRGNSKYHYNGVYLKPLSPLMVILNLLKTQQGLSYEGNGKRGRRVRRCFEGAQGRGGPGGEFFRNREADDFMDCSPDEYLGKRPEIETPFAQLQVDPAVIPKSLDESSVHLFESIYYGHCQALLTHFENFDLKQVFDEWKRFWRLKCNSPVAGEGVIKYRDVMSKTTLFKVCSLEATQAYVMSMDLATYQYIIDILFPCLSKGMPITMINGMRNFIKDVDYIFFKILDGYPKNLAEVKLRCLRSFIAMWNDYTRLNRMLKPAVTTIRNDDNISAMYSELCRSINFQDLENQVGIGNKVNEAFLQDLLILEFRRNLDNQNGNLSYSVKSWICWAEQVAQKLIEESGRQVSEGEQSRMRDPFLIWKKTSDRILGAIVKGNAVSFGVFKSFLIWCDNLIKHISKLTMARSEGYVLEIFYYESNLEESELKPLEPLLYNPMIQQIKNDGHWNDMGNAFQVSAAGPSYAHQVEIGGINDQSPNQQGLSQQGNLAPEISEAPDGNGEQRIVRVLDPTSDKVYYVDTTEMSKEDLSTFVKTVEGVGADPELTDTVPDSILKEQQVVDTEKKGVEVENKNEDKDKEKGVEEEKKTEQSPDS